MPLGEAVFVEDDGRWLPGVIQWEYHDTGRVRALVRYTTASGVVVRRLHWRDQLRTGVVIELGLRQVGTTTDQPEGSQPESRQPESRH
ncbi:MAG: hypothetical protein ACRDWY_17135 [Actinomycetes bacterium]